MWDPKYLTKIQNINLIMMSLAVLVQKMSKHITPDIKNKAEEQLDKWFTECAKCGVPGICE